MPRLALHVVALLVSDAIAQLLHDPAAPSFMIDIACDAQKAQQPNNPHAQCDNHTVLYIAETAYNGTWCEGPPITSFVSELDKCEVMSETYMDLYHDASKKYSHFGYARNPYNNTLVYCSGFSRSSCDAQLANAKMGLIDPEACGDDGTFPSLTDTRYDYKNNSPPACWRMDGYGAPFSVTLELSLGMDDHSHECGSYPNGLPFVCLNTSKVCRGRLEAITTKTESAYCAGMGKSDVCTSLALFRGGEKCNLVDDFGVPLPIQSVPGGCLDMVWIQEGLDEMMMLGKMDVTLTMVIAGMTVATCVPYLTLLTTVVGLFMDIADCALTARSLAIMEELDPILNLTQSAQCGDYNNPAGQQANLQLYAIADDVQSARTLGKIELVLAFVNTAMTCVAIGTAVGASVATSPQTIGAAFFAGSLTLTISVIEAVLTYVRFYQRQTRDRSPVSSLPDRPAALAARTSCALLTPPCELSAAGGAPHLPGARAG